MAGSEAIDRSVRHAARIYDYLLGGTSNFPVDRRAAEATFADLDGGPADHPGLQRADERDDGGPQRGRAGPLPRRARARGPGAGPGGGMAARRVVTPLPFLGAVARKP